MKKLTPVYEQYLSIKRDHPDALLFFRMGDFYELFFEDAVAAARDLQIALTSRNPNSDTAIPMCGVPHHAAETYIGQLLDMGHRVALCDQVEDPKKAKGLVKRAVTRVFTPGTVVEDLGLPGKADNLLAALYWDSDKGAGGLGWIEFSTGRWSGIQSRREPDLWQWAAKIDPRELLLPDDIHPPRQYDDLGRKAVRLSGRAFFDLKGGMDKIKKAQKVSDAAVLDLDDKPQLVRALGAMLAYLAQTQRREAEHLGAFRPLNVSRHLIVDEMTERNLELFQRMDGRAGKGTLLAVLDHTCTPMGARLLARRLKNPWRGLSRIEKALASVCWLFEADGLRQALGGLLDKVHDLERLITRIFLGRANPKDFASLRAGLAMLPRIREALRAAVDSERDTAPASPCPPEPRRLLALWDDLADMEELLSKTLVDSPPPLVTEGGLFREGWDPKLDELIQLTEHGRSRLKALLERERADLGLPKLKLGFNKVFGHYFEISKTFQGELPERFIRRQTLVNSERYVTGELSGLEERLASASEERKALEYELFNRLRDEVAKARPRFMHMASALAGIDYWRSLAEAARLNSWVRPELGGDPAVMIKGLRHPVVEAVQGSSDYVPNDLAMDESRRVLVITGPNMAGKSTILRAAAVAQIMAQMGSFVPAESASIGLADRVFTRVGASDNLAQGVSTFMAEMTETARILRQATAKSLVILDEIGRGTSTFDGMALAWAVVEELARRGKGGIRTLFATHYHELTELERVLPPVANYNIAVKEWKGEVIFLRRLVPGPSDKSYGIEVAKLAGVPQGVVGRAKEMLARLEESGGDRAKTRRTLAMQAVLPGLEPPEPKPTPVRDHPVLVELGNLDPDGLTPIQALNLLHRFKNMLGEEQ